MRNSLEEALQVLESLRERVDSNERRPSAEEICIELTHVMALIGEYAQGETRSAKVLPPTQETPAAPVVDTDDQGSQDDAAQLAEAMGLQEVAPDPIDVVAEAEEVLPDPGESYR